MHIMLAQLDRVDSISLIKSGKDLNAIGPDFFSWLRYVGYSNSLKSLSRWSPIGA